MKLPVAPNNIWGSSFFRTLQCEKTKGIIHSRIIPAIKALTKEQWRHNSGIVYISALISCNVIIKNYVNRKIKSYIYLLIFKISLWLYCTKEKGKCEKNFFVVITDQDYPCQHIDQWPQESTMYDITGDNKEKNMCTYT